MTNEYQNTSNTLNSFAGVRLDAEHCGETGRPSVHGLIYLPDEAELTKSQSWNGLDQVPMCTNPQMQ